MFDYQYFVKNKLLDDVIKEIGEPGECVLSDDDIAIVNAAVEPETHRFKNVKKIHSKTLTELSTKITKT